MNVFLDTDVIIDYLTDRNPFAERAEKVFALIEQHKINGFTSALCFSNIYYLIRQYHTHQKAISILKNLADLLSILKVDANIVLGALDSGFNDFEDAIQYFTAKDQKKMDAIVTRNIRDFRKSTLPAVTPDTLVRSYSDQL